MIGLTAGATPPADPRKILIIQTAFLGDFILTLPLVQVLRKLFPASEIDLVARPDAIPAAKNHPDIHSLIAYDKRGSEKGLGAFVRLSGVLRKNNYDLAIIPHRSMRSALLAWNSRIPRRIGFDRSAGRFLLTEVVPYRASSHEYRRNLDLLAGLGMHWEGTEYPSLYPGAGDCAVVEGFFQEKRIAPLPIVAVAPGTLWNTKRWPPERYARVAAMLAGKGFGVILIGGDADSELCTSIASQAGDPKVVSTAGRFSILQSAEAIRRCGLLICNDSAPLHFGVGVRTPVLAIFGATTPSIGFGPYGEFDRIVELTDLPCRPCSIHGGDKCPIGTFECMLGIHEQRVFDDALAMLGKASIGKSAI